MRKIKLKNWIKKSSDLPTNKASKERPTPDWKLSDSIKYIKRRDEYLREEGILVKKEERNWKLNV